MSMIELAVMVLLGGILGLISRHAATGPLRLLVAAYLAVMVAVIIQYA